MQIKGVKYIFKAEPWQYRAPGGWFFVSFPAALAEEIRNMFRSEEEGWGRLKATAKIGNSEWKTAIWFDTKMNTYLLPLKAEIRRNENLTAGKEIEVTVWIQLTCSFRSLNEKACKLSGVFPVNFENK